MPKKPKPPYVWDEGSPDGYEYPTLFDWHYNELAEILNTPKFSREICLRLQEAVRNFFAWKDYTAHKPRRADVISTLKKIEKLSKELIDVFDNIDSLTLNALLETKPFYLTRSFLPLPPFFKEDANNDYGLFDDQADFRKLHTASREALLTLQPDKGGRTNESVPKKLLILDLEPIYFEVTGRPATITWNNYEETYGGRFFNFTIAFLKIINQQEEVWSNNALGKLIKRTLPTKATPKK